MFAVVRVRSSVNASPNIKTTLRLLKLSRPNHCVVYRKDKSIEGMLHSVDRLVTWGEIDETTLEKLIFKRGRMPGNKRVEKKDAKEIAKKIREGKETDVKRVFRLNPPSGGYKSVLEFYPKGALGNRGKEINELLKRMI
jgi:large subunit ribosomal protein L30